MSPNDIYEGYINACKYVNLISKENWEEWEKWCTIPITLDASCLWLPPELPQVLIVSS